MSNLSSLADHHEAVLKGATREVCMVVARSQPMNQRGISDMSTELQDIVQGFSTLLSAILCPNYYSLLVPCGRFSFRNNPLEREGYVS